MMITQTFVKCDQCGRAILGCEDDNYTRAATALATARSKGYGRSIVKGQPRDLCDECLELECEKEAAK